MKGYLKMPCITFSVAFDFMEQTLKDSFDTHATVVQVHSVGTVVARGSAAVGSRTRQHQFILNNNALLLLLPSQTAVVACFNGSVVVGK